MTRDSISSAPARRRSSSARAPAPAGTTRRGRPRLRSLTGPSRSPPRQRPRRRPPKPKGSARTGCLILLGVAAVIAVIIIAIVTLTGGSGGSYKAAVENYTVINPADLAVAVRVTNTGSSAGTPTCTVNAADPSGAYSGFDEGTLTSPVAAGATVTYVDNVTITGQGAQYITQVTVSC